MSAAARRRPLDAMQLAGALSADGPPGPGGGRRSPCLPRRARRRHALSAGGAAAFLVGGLGGLRPPGALGPRRAARSTTSGAWAPSPSRATASRCSSTPTRSTTAQALAGLEAATERPTSRLRGGLRQPAPPPDAARRWAGPGVSAEQLEGTSFVGRDRQPRRGLGGARPGAGPGRRRARRPPAGARLRRRRGDRPGRRGRRRPARDRAPPARSPARRSTCSTYYRWTRGRQAEPH